MTRSSMTRMENMILMPPEHWPRRWPVMRVIGKKEVAINLMGNIPIEVEEIEMEKDITRYINGEKVNVKETA